MTAYSNKSCLNSLQSCIGLGKKLAVGVAKHSIMVDSLSEWDLSNYSCFTLGEEVSTEQLSCVFMSNYIAMTGWTIQQISVKYDSRHSLNDTLTFRLSFFFYFKKMLLLLVIKDHKHTLWSLTGPKLLLNLICSISIVFSKLYTCLLGILQTIRTLLGDWGKWLNLGLSDALTGSCACAFSRRFSRG